MVLGPGSPGCLRDSDSDYSHLTAAKRGSLLAMANDVMPGDFVVMRVGPQLVGIGQVPNGTAAEYEWNPTFDDIHGWDLHHTRRVCWRPIEEFTNGEAAWVKNFFSGRWGMFSRVRAKEMVDRLAPLIGSCATRKLRPLPPSAGPLLEDEEVGELLFSRGLSQDSVDALLESIARQRRLLRWYREYGKESARPREHEVVAYMILPMLLALGWSEQLLAVEWNKVDLAAFRRTPTRAADCVLVCEAKAMRSGLQGRPQKQAQAYVLNQKLGSCRHILLTQGQRFYLYQRASSGDWIDEPVGYFNLLKLRHKYVMPANTSAIDTLISLTPQAILGNQGL